MDDYDYQRAMVSALRAEIAARGWTRKELGERAGINEQTMLRTFLCKRAMNVAQLSAMADALGVTIEYLAGEADRWARDLPATRSDRPVHRPTDPRELIAWLIANPSQDDVLNTRLSEVERRTGLTGNALAQLRDQVTRSRRAELTKALRALPPSENRASNDH
jgi:transcriptional regulator with XRE-family HTH domain